MPDKSVYYNADFTRTVLNEGAQNLKFCTLLNYSKLCRARTFNVFLHTLVSHTVRFIITKYHIREKNIPIPVEDTFSEVAVI